MSRTGFRAVSHRIKTEKAIKHIGTASIKLDVLDFPYSEGLDRENVERLKTLFKTAGGYIPGDVSNRIPAIIHERQLHEALGLSGVSAETLLSDAEGNFVELEFPPGFRLECLRGRHRAKAADEFLDSQDKRWVVDLFLAGKSDLNTL